MSIEKALVPPHSLGAVKLGVVVFEVILPFTFHWVTRFAPPVPVMSPVPTKSRSFVPSKNSNKGEQMPTGLVVPLICVSLDMAAVLFMVPLGDENDNA